MPDTMAFGCSLPVRRALLGMDTDTIREIHDLQPSDAAPYDTDTANIVTNDTDIRICAATRK